MTNFNCLVVDPFSRINDRFASDASIDATPLCQSVRHYLITTPPNSLAHRFQADFYHNVACDFVVETALDYPYPYISEKTLRPISCKRMFIVLGPVGVLSLLRSKGFVTWGDFVDESYDQIPDARDRFRAVVDQVRRICDRPLSEVVQYLKQNQSRLEHNFATLVNLQDRELDELEKKLP